MTASDSWMKMAQESLLNASLAGCYIVKEKIADSAPFVVLILCDKSSLVLCLTGRSQLSVNIGSYDAEWVNLFHTKELVTTKAIRLKRSHYLGCGDTYIFAHDIAEMRSRGIAQFPFEE